MRVLLFTLCLKNVVIWRCRPTVCRKNRC